MPHAKFIVAGTLIIGAIVYLMFSGINDSMVYYYSVSELLASAEDLNGKGVRVSGYVAPGTIQRTSGTSQVEFLVFEKESEKRLPVVYRGIIPDTFKENAEVVVEGTYLADQHRFQANTLLAKCPSKYESQGEEHPDDVPLGKEAN
ncbi:MAG TPA: cytochrome c maturation protein CcmE [Acidobacteriota bacterium]|nr:cytochrome c maturation protein CcmE [Acidobacteriota bacterium]